MILRVESEDSLSINHGDGISMKILVSRKGVGGQLESGLPKHTVEDEPFEFVWVGL